MLVLDADGQDPPELIPEFVGKWREGFDVVFGTRSTRPGETWLKRATASAFYRVMNRLADPAIPADTGDFRLMSRRVVEALARLARTATVHERVVRLGRLSAGVDRLPAPAADRRHQQVQLLAIVELRAGRHHRLFHRAAAGGDLRRVCGPATFAFIYGAWVVAKTLLWGEPVQGWPTLMAVVLFLGGVQLMALGVIGEYLGRLYLESKQRPLYLVQEWQPARRADGCEAGGRRRGIG